MDAARQVASSVRALRDSPKELFVCYVLKFFESFIYFSISQVLVIFLHNDYGFSDVAAGTLYGLWGCAITLVSLLTSSTNDNLGVRVSLIVGFSISAVSSLAMALTNSKITLYINLLLVLPLSESIGMPMLTVAVKRYTSKHNRGFAFGVFYSVMNMAAFASGPVVDICNLYVSNTLSFNGHKLSGNRMVIISTFIASIIAIAVSHFCVREIEVVDEESYEKGGDEPAKADKELPQGDADGNVKVFTIEQQSLKTTLLELLKSKTFWRFALMSLFLINLKAVFRHLDATLPTYLVRTFGSDIPKGMIYAINPFIIVILTPLVSALTQRFEHFDMIKWGGWITATAPFFLAFSSSISAVLLFVVFLSLGEAIWSPRVYDYTMSVSPKGREASFAALAAAPLFLAKVPVGLLSGYLVSKYIPEEGPGRPQMLWLIIGLLTLSSPVLINLFEKCIREPAASVAGTGRGVPMSSFSILPSEEEALDDSDAIEGGSVIDTL